MATQTDADRAGDEFDYIVVGSGAGGGTVAANLARAGHRVLVLEAGGDEQPGDYSMPAFHALSAEHNDLSWKYYVQHYQHSSNQKRDTLNYLDDKSVDGRVEQGIFYPRAGTLGGCTAHHAMICMYPHHCDWDHIADITGDESWRPERMREHFVRLEHCDYANFFSRLFNRARHGFKGWLHTSTANPLLLTRDWTLAALVFAALTKSFVGKLASPREFERHIRALIRSWLDPNDWRRVTEGYEGAIFTPLTIRAGHRIGTRERLNETRLEHPDKLTVRLHALATKIVFEGERAVGVEFVDGAHLYWADPKAARNTPLTPERQVVRARREVILAGGTFNTPQLLMLSGIGPASHLKALGIDVRVDLPDVGRNLQDRYEIGIVHELPHPFAILKDATFVVPEPGKGGDRNYQDWVDGGRGLYATNGAVIALIKKSDPSRADPDLYMFLVPGPFSGYRPDFSKDIRNIHNQFTWVILKGHTNNSAGWVRLRSTDPRDTPDINFKYFDEGNDSSGDDLRGVVVGIETIRAMMDGGVLQLVGGKEVIPGRAVATRQQVEDFVRSNAWGHHACGTCRIGPDGKSVLDSRFRVRGVAGLRVVDASVFPRIPGLFILSAVYMVGEKASAAILDDAAA
jgi:choline dehydrogenase